MTLLDWVLFLPLAGFFLLLLVPKNNPQASRMTALLVSIAAFAASLGCTDIEIFPSSIPGGDGNAEFFLGARRG